MSTFLKTALTATLAVSVSVTLVGSKLVHAEASCTPYDSDTLSVKSPVNSVVPAPICSNIRSLADPLISSFDPEPNEPPKSSGGLGTR
ncbi:MAG: hypothetical protein MUC48_05560 [Leptolyngbya sp. Prado105]|jgi:hypothetical protein|nr:hypothetical protein [Leptolyngbya sp. Prado105]